MKILLTVPSLAREFGGPVEKAFKLASSLRTLGNEVSILGCGEMSGEIEIPILFSFHTTPFPRSIRPIKQAVRQADIVHVFGYRDPVGTIAAHLARRLGVPYLIEPVGMHRRRIRSAGLKATFDGLLGQRILRNASGIIATSELERTELQEDGVAAHLIRVRPNGVNVPVALPPRGQLRKRFAIPQSAQLVLYLGRINRKKGLPHLTRALAGREGVRGLMVGVDDDGTMREILRERRRLGLEKTLLIHPQGLWGEGKWGALVDADVFCLFSETENFGNAAAEAACAGTPVVVTDACGVAEWLDPAARKVIPFGDEALLRSALSEILSNPSYKSAAVEGATRLRESLNWTRIAHLQMEIYHSVLGVEATK